MAYQGTTSTAPNPPILITQGIGVGSTAGSNTQAQWFYRSTHTQALAAAAGFFTDGQVLGLKLGNSMLVMGTTTYVLSHHTVNAVSSTGATISAGLLVSSAS